jgi:hypothetical protein
MVIGVISLIGQLHNWPNVDDEPFFGGATMILGAIAYRSAKQRRLGLKQDTVRRRLLEISLLILVFLPIPFAAVLPNGIVHHPWSSLLIPVWSLVANLMFVTNA